MRILARISHPLSARSLFPTRLYLGNSVTAPGVTLARQPLLRCSSSCIPAVVLHACSRPPSLESCPRLRRCARKMGSTKCKLRLRAPAALHSPIACRQGHAVRGVPARRREGSLDLRVFPPRSRARLVATGISAPSRRYPVRKASLSGQECRQPPVPRLRIAIGPDPSSPLAVSATKWCTSFSTSAQ